MKDFWCIYGIIFSFQSVLSFCLCSDLLSSLLNQIFLSCSLVCKVLSNLVITDVAPDVGGLRVCVTRAWCCRARHGRRTTTCCGTTTTSGLTSCSAWRTSCATRTCAARARCRSRRPPTTRTWWRSARATTWWRRNTTRARAATSRPAARTARPSPWRAPSPCTPSPRRSCISLNPPRLAAEPHELGFVSASGSRASRSNPGSCEQRSSLRPVSWYGSGSADGIPVESSLDRV